MVPWPSRLAAPPTRVGFLLVGLGDEDDREGTGSLSSILVGLVFPSLPVISLRQNNIIYIYFLESNFCFMFNYWPFLIIIYVLHGEAGQYHL